MRLSLTHRARVRALSALLFAALLSQIGFVPMAAQAQAQPDWLVAVNNIRTSAGLPAVVADSASTTGAINHSRYIVQNNTLTHTEVAGMPGFTTGGASAGKSGDISTSTSLPSPVDAVTGFMPGGYHWEAILDSGLTSIGYGAATYQDVFPGQTNTTRNIGAAQTLVFNRPLSRPTKQIMWPPSGGSLAYTSYVGGEVPNPLASCTGYTTPTGPALSLQLPATPQVSNVSLTETGVAGDLASCWYTATNVKFDAKDSAWVSTGTSILTNANAVNIFPQKPLTNGTYCLSVTNAGVPIQWSFTVGSSPATPPVPCGTGVVATSTPVPAATATPFVLDTSSMVQLVAGQQLNAGQQLLSMDGKTQLLMQTDGNLCLYRVDNGAVLWCSSTAGKPGAHAVMQADGNFVIYSSDNSVAYWTAGTSGNSGASLVLSNDGNLGIFDSTQGRLWSTGTAWNMQTAAPTATPVPSAPTATAMPGAPTATPGASGTARLVAGQQLTVNQPLAASNGTSRLLLQSDGNLVLYRSDNRVLWQSGTAGKPMVQVLMQADGNLAGYNANLTVVYWNAGTNGHPGASLILRDDGNLLVVDANGTQLWATNTTVN